MILLQLIWWAGTRVRRYFIKYNNFQLSCSFYKLLQMILSLYSSTPSSLIIVDEFGKGTTEIDGLALLASCLDHFLSREVKCPHVLASTHFHDVVSLVQKSRYLKLQVSASKKNSQRFCLCSNFLLSVERVKSKVASCRAMSFFLKTDLCTVRMLII